MKGSFAVVTYLAYTASAFELFAPKTFPSFPFGNNKKPQALETTKQELFTAIAPTNNGKSATPQQQVEVLSLVKILEESEPVPFNLLTEQTELIDGTWYLQYTSPSVIDDPEILSEESAESATIDTWSPEDATEGDSRIDTRRFKAQGTVSAAGIVVDTSGRLTRQTIDASEGRVTNDVGGQPPFQTTSVRVAGGFRPSPTVPTRAIVSFDTIDINLLNGAIKLDLAWIFTNVLPVFKNGSRDNGWLQTTYIDSSLRIGRGNKGTLFILTREPNPF